MTMSAFLLLLVKLNLAMGAAIVLVSLLRSPLRLLFGAPIAYAIWFLVPSAGIASLFPPRVGAPAPIPSMPVPAAPVSVMAPIAHSALRVTEQLTGQGALTAIAPPPLAPATAMPDTALLLFAAWALGMLFMALYLTRLQLRFSTAVRLREAGPAVLGFLRPRIVTPDGFQERFTPQEQAAILAHERVHLARQDARINALAALLRCLCWFNPLIHLGARWLRIDQELACDATVVAGCPPSGPLRQNWGFSQGRNLVSSL
jgi:beta-lactamase regulating signal transducer with metallopeptidase domain